MDGARATLPSGGGAEGENILPQAQPVVDLALEDRLSLLGALALAMDDAGTADAATGALGEKFVAKLGGEDDGQAMEVQLQFRFDGTTLEVGEDALLDPGPGEEQEFLGLYLRLRQQGLFFLAQILGLLDGVGWRPPAPGFRAILGQGLGVRHLGAK